MFVVKIELNNVMKVNYAQLLKSKTTPHLSMDQGKELYSILSDKVEEFVKGLNERRHNTEDTKSSK
jgi:hypothetical protein